MSSLSNLKEALINGIIAVRSVLQAVTLRSDDEFLVALGNVKRRARIAAHYAIIHLNQSGHVPLPRSQAEKEFLIGLLQAGIYKTPRPLKSIAGEGRSRPGREAARRSVASKRSVSSSPIRAASEQRPAPVQVSEEDWMIRKWRQPLDATEPEPAGSDVDDALDTIVRGSLVLRGSVQGRVISPELADALDSIVRGALLSRDCIRKQRWFFNRPAAP